MPESPDTDFCRCDDNGDGQNNEGPEHQGAAVASGSAVIGVGVGAAVAPAAAQGILGLVGFGAQGVVGGMSSL